MAAAKKKVAVKTNDGREQVTEVENYSAKDIVKLLNDPSETMVAIGDVIVNRSFVQSVKPVENE